MAPNMKGKGSLYIPTVTLLSGVSLPWTLSSAALTLWSLKYHALASFHFLEIGVADACLTHSRGDFEHLWADGEAQGVVDGVQSLAVGSMHSARQTVSSSQGGLTTFGDCGFRSGFECLRIVFVVSK